MSDKTIYELELKLGFFSQLVQAKDRQIKLLSARSLYNENDELQDVLWQENAKALEEVYNQIARLEVLCDIK